MSTAQYTTNQDTSAIFEADLVDAEGDPVAAASLSTLTLTLFDVGTDTIINARNLQNVLNTNNVTIDANGHLTFRAGVLDNPFLGSAPALHELHHAVLAATWPSGEGLTYVFEIDVQRTGR